MAGNLGFCSVEVWLIVARIQWEVFQFYKSLHLEEISTIQEEICCKASWRRMQRVYMMKSSGWSRECWKWYTDRYDSRRWMSHLIWKDQEWTVRFDPETRRQMSDMVWWIVLKACRQIEKTKTWYWLEITMILYVYALRQTQNVMTLLLSCLSLLSLLSRWCWYLNDIWVCCHDSHVLCPTDGRGGLDSRQNW